jgi:hypothetical protein
METEETRKHDEFMSKTGGFGLYGDIKSKGDKASTLNTT